MEIINGINLHTTRKVIPKIYAYTTPEIKRHDGWLKIGYTEQDDVRDRIKQQCNTADVEGKLEWFGDATFDDSNKTFTDKMFHTYLIKQGYEKIPQKEWFKIGANEGKSKFYEFKKNGGVLSQGSGVIPYDLRPEQKVAVEYTSNYFSKHPQCEFLWNCKPRFGKTLAAFDLCKVIEAKKVLIVTNRPSTATSWYADYEKFLGTESGYRFVSTDQNIKNKPLVLSRDKYESFNKNNPTKQASLIEFISLQDMKGSVYFGGTFDKLEVEQREYWDLLVIDEAHEGVDTYKTDKAFDDIRRNFTLHLSGTPFKQIANSKFEKDAIFNWTYADEQKAKENWNDENMNPYFDLPRLSMYTYQMSEIARKNVAKGIEIEDTVEEFAFDLNEFFATNKSGEFIHDKSVNDFLEALTTQEKFPFSTKELREELKHTFWVLNRVNSAKALAKKLKCHPIFKDYKIISVAGDGRIDEDKDTTNKKAYAKVIETIHNSEKTITLSVGQLTTGVTIPEWTAVLMLSNMSSPALYMQAAFRAQNACLFHEGNEYRRKENSYIFDFDPARTLDIYEKFANNLNLSTVEGRGTQEEHEKNVRKLLNFFPVYGEDEDGKMIELDAKQLLKVPLKIRSKEVIKRGFMSNFLFNDIGIVFNAPKNVLNILKHMNPEPKTSIKKNNTDHLGEIKDLKINKDGEVEIPHEIVIGQAREVFGDKIFETNKVKKMIDANTKIFAEESTNENDKIAAEIIENIEENEIIPRIAQAEKELNKKLTKAEKKELSDELKKELESTVVSQVDNYKKNIRMIEIDSKKDFDQAQTDQAKTEIYETYEALKEEAKQDLQKALESNIKTFMLNTEEKTVTKINESIQNEKKNKIEDDVRDHLRGFTRTIPSFLMAYGDEDVTLETFDQIIPDEVFKEITSISLDDFRFLRDGGDYTDEEGNTKHFKGNIFDTMVFNDSITEFVKLKYKLADYFNETNSEDIFDYIPPQKTNQIFTPKKIVKQMVDYLEQENPNCFDNPNNTFIDLYMKSGLYITEIVKRLYNSPKMIKLYPDSEARLKHIFAKQVYGLAPTEIIYQIVLSFVFGFDHKHTIKEHNLRRFDALPSAQDGTLKEKLDEIFDKN